MVVLCGGLWHFGSRNGAIGVVWTYRLLAKKGKKLATAKGEDRKYKYRLAL